MKITDLKAREILDSRGNPTIEVDCILEDGSLGRFSVPSGASTGKKEALELRDGDDSRFNGLGVLKAVNNVNTKIKNAIIGMDGYDQNAIDSKLLELDSTDNKRMLGANAILGASFAVLKASSISRKEELYETIDIDEKRELPLLMVNVINGGKHANNNIDFQEFMLVPIGTSIKERVRIATEVFHSLKKILQGRGMSTAVGDEGGFAPDLDSNYEVFELLMEAVKRIGLTPGVDVCFAIDVASSELYYDDKYHFDGKALSSSELINYYESLVNKYPIISIEDPVMEDDFETFASLTKLIGDRVQLVGDDLFVTNKKYLQKGISMKAGNAILIKPNQIGTYTETIDTIKLARANKYNVIISHRSGETEDTTIADLAVAVGAEYIKTGSMSRGERICKYNRLIRIEEQLAGKNIK